MANRTFTSVDALQKQVVILEANCVMDSGHTAKVRSLKGSGIKSIVVSATGTFTITFEDPYFRYLGGHMGIVGAGTSSGIVEFQVVGDPNSTCNNSAAPTMVVKCFNAAGAAATPADGLVVGFIFFMRNSSVKGKGE